MKYYTDCFVIGTNPSQIGGGYTIMDENNNLIKQETVEKVGFTNNEGELLGILNALRLAESGDVISTDSMCCMSWCFKGKSKSRPDLLNVFKECNELITKKKINLCWEGRNFNLAGIHNETKGKISKKFKSTKGQLLEEVTLKLYD